MSAAIETRFHTENLGGAGRAGETARWLGALALVCAGLLAFRWIALAFNATDLFFDEAQYWAWGEEPAFGYYSKPPLIAWMIAVSGSICGDSTFCVRAPSALTYVVGAFGLFAAATQLYGARVGFWSGLVFLTLPGVSLSAGIISTDVPLLAAWAWALAALVALVRMRGGDLDAATGAGGWLIAVGLGVALGIGLNGKYAMAYFVLCLVVYAVAVPRARGLLADGRIWLAIAIAAAMIAPNIAWNLDNGFATFSHTADNAKWEGPLGHPDKALEFFASQFGVFGPILFAGLLVVAVRAWRDGLSDADALLFCFTVPVILIVTTQAFLSRAHANWAAVSYVAGAILVTAVMIRRLEWRWLWASTALHLAVMVVLAVGLALAGRVALPGGTDPFARTLGWQALGAEVGRTLDQARQAGRPFATVLTDTRALSAELLYYLRDRDVSIRAWRGDGPPRDHFALTRPFKANPAEPVLLVSMRADVRDKILTRFGSVASLGRAARHAGGTKDRDLAHFYRLDGFTRN